MLQNDLELIVQYPDGSGSRCRGFKGLHLAAPVFVVFDGALHVDQVDANMLGTAFCAELARYFGSREEPGMPCPGSVAQVDCHATQEPSCEKVLVWLAGRNAGGGSPPAPTATSLWLQHWPNPKWHLIPIMPAGATPATYLPPQWQGINTSFWNRDPTESLWAIMQRAGLAPEESRVFISYVRRDTTAIADQLFTALTIAGFDVFLDRSSVPLGVEFQERLLQDLVDKAMVILLNSVNVNQSKWVGEEIATIKKYRLGLLELRFPDVPERGDIDPDFTVDLQPADLIAAGPNYAAAAQILNDTKRDDVVQRVKETHNRSLHRRRYELIDNFAATLTAAGKNAQALPDGTFVLTAHGSRPETVVGLTTRIPELGDFYSLHQRGSVSPTRSGWLISPAPFFVAQRQAHVSWLGKVSNIKHANEAQIGQVIDSL